MMRHKCLDFLRARLVFSFSSLINYYFFITIFQGFRLALIICIVIMVGFGIVYWNTSFDDYWVPVALSDVEDDGRKTFQTMVRLREKSEFVRNSNLLLVDTPWCKIPDIDPYDESILSLVNYLKPYRCRSFAKLTYDIKDELFINWTAAKLPPYNGTIMYCSYVPICRPNFTCTNKNLAQFPNESKPFYSSVKINYDFVKVLCYNNSKDIQYTYFHSFIPRNKSADVLFHNRYIKHISENHITERLNVIMLAIDSLSRLTFIRQMKKTRQYIQKTLGAVEMMGYNKVGEDTVPNMLALTLSKLKSEVVDKSGENYIWKQFSLKGYRTIYSEDRPDQAFSSRFKIPPTEYFDRPLRKAMLDEEQSKRIVQPKQHICFRNKLQAELMLAYVHKFLDSYKRDPYFVFMWTSSIAHNNFNGPLTADDHYYDFLKQLNEEGLLNNTVLLFFSDHGFRFGRLRKTEIGRYEARLPLMFLYLPEWFRKKYPVLDKNLLTNRHRLSTPFDLYETLKDVLYFGSPHKTMEPYARGISWFKPIPFNRSCASALISSHFCTCLEKTPLPVTDHIVQRASQTLVKTILQSLQPYSDLCELIKLAKINKAASLVTPFNISKIQNDKETNMDGATGHVNVLQIVITTSPGDAVFEATYEEDIYDASSKRIRDISRINAYGDAADCLNDKDIDKAIRNYCLCKMH